MPEFLRQTPKILGVNTGRNMPSQRYTQGQRERHLYNTELER